MTAATAAGVQAPDYSVVIPTKDRSGLLGRALRCVLAQRDVSLEVLVVDDGDGSGAALAVSLDDVRVRVLDNQRAGQVRARNRALAAARGEAIAFLDDDDWWDDAGTLARHGEIRPAGGVSYTGAIIVPEGAGVTQAEPLLFTPSWDRASIRRDFLLIPSGTTFDRALWLRYGPFDEDLPVYWDWDWFLRLSEAGCPFRHLPGMPVRMSARSDTQSSASRQATRATNLARFAAKHGLTGLKLRNHQSIAADQAGKRHILST